VNGKAGCVKIKNRELSWIMGKKDADNDRNSQLLQELDAGSRRMLLYMMKHKHASIDELTEVLGESCHMNTLVRIKNIVNPKAIAVLKRPVLRFEKLHVNPENGENVLFNWWLTEKNAKKTLQKKEEQFADVFDEDKEVLVIMDMKGVRAESIHVDSNQESVRISFQDFDNITHVQQISLPVCADISGFRKQFQNQTMIINIPKNAQ
jgi:HSP20 family molecular chaperone IbpA